MAATTSGTVADAIGRRSAVRNRWWWAGTVLAVLLLVLLASQLRGRQSPITYQTSPVVAGRLVVKVSATGNLQPTNQVDIGSELSGTVEKVFVDDNDRVRKGQLLAVLDLAKLNDQVARSEATLAQAQAQVLLAAASTKEARANLQRLREVARLSNGQVPAKSEMTTAEATLQRALATDANARAAVTQAAASLRSDRTTVTKASIRSPIDGVVLARKVEPGQTVAASLQAPVLFSLAENLAQMQLQVNVDEADVGQVSVGQPASFSVDAYPDRSFPASIVRVGLGSQTVNNVVSYLTMLNVDNRDLSLRPGMTATAEIVTFVREHTLLVPNAALRWSPPASATQPKRSFVNSLMPRPSMRGTGSRPRTATKSLGRGKHQTVWVLGDNGKPQPVQISAGASDGQSTEIIDGALKPGQAVIVDSVEAKP